jgi:hypothetical protein
VGRHLASTSAVDCGRLESRLQLLPVAAGNGSSQEASMKDESSDRHQAIRLRLGSARRAHLPSAGTFARLVSHLVASLPGSRCDGVLRPDACDSPTAAHCARFGAHDPQCSSASRITDPSANPLQLDWRSAILAELKALNIRPLPCVRTIESVRACNGLTVPRIRLAH